MLFKKCHCFCCISPASGDGVIAGMSPRRASIVWPVHQRCRFTPYPLFCLRLLSLVFLILLVFPIPHIPHQSFASINNPYPSQPPFWDRENHSVLIFTQNQQSYFSLFFAAINSEEVHQHRSLPLRSTAKAWFLTGLPRSARQHFQRAGIGTLGKSRVSVLSRAPSRLMEIWKPRTSSFPPNLICLVLATLKTFV